MTQPIFTPEECGEFLYDWLRGHCNSASLKSVAQDVGYKYSFFAPTKKLHLLEELTFLYISLAIHGVNQALNDYETIESIVDAFLEKMRNRILGSMESDDKNFQDRYSTRVGTYFELLNGGGDALGVAGDFLAGLFGTPEARLRLTAVKLVKDIMEAQASLQKVFNKIDVSKK